MITCNIAGCLGNQLSQIAATYVLALDNNDECGFNFYEREEAGLSGHGPGAYVNNIYKKLNPLPEGWTPEVYYQEPSYDYAPIPYQPNMALGGYFGSEKYINHRRKEVIDLFKDEETIKTITGDFTNSLSIHVRRGDYINKPTIHPMLKMEYYHKAIEYVTSRVKIDRMYLFTEDRDILWCKKRFRHMNIIYTDGLPDYIHLYMQSLCTHNIIANSSFSWWGSYLNENPDKIIVAPKTWHGAGLIPPSNAFYCDNWVLIENQI